MWSIYQPGTTTVGELCIGGHCVARGYWRRPPETERSFIEHPEGKDLGRFYRSGGLARMREDRVLEFVGRLDDEMNIRGWRVHPADWPPGSPADGATCDRLLFFTRPECPACDAIWNKLMKRFDDIPRIDVYLTDVAPGDDAAVRAWALRHHVDPEWVRHRRVTLNHDGGALDHLTKGEGNAPYLLRRRGEALSSFEASEL